MEKEIRVNWKPLMSKAEAEEYTKDSYYQSKDFYHGTGKEAADNITSKGVLIVSESVNTYGEGFYLAFKKESAKEYASQKDNPVILAAKVRVKNPRKFRDSIDLEDFLDTNNIPADDSQSKAVSKLLISQGYDAVEIGGNRVLIIIFNKTQVAIFQSEKL